MWEVLGDYKEVWKGCEEMDEVQTFNNCDLPSTMLEVIFNSFWYLFQRNSIDNG